MREYRRRGETMEKRSNQVNLILGIKTKRKKTLRNKNRTELGSEEFELVSRVKNNNSGPLG